MYRRRQMGRCRLWSKLRPHPSCNFWCGSFLSTAVEKRPCMKPSYSWFRRQMSRVPIRSVTTVCNSACTDRTKLRRTKTRYGCAPGIDPVGQRSQCPHASLYLPRTLHVTPKVPKGGDHPHTRSRATEWMGTRTTKDGLEPSGLQVCSALYP